MEAEPLIVVTQEAIIKFIKHSIIYRFGIPESIITNQGTMLLKIKWAHSYENSTLSLYIQHHPMHK